MTGTFHPALSLTSVLPASAVMETPDPAPKILTGLASQEVLSLARRSRDGSSNPVAEDVTKRRNPVTAFENIVKLGARLDTQEVSLTSSWLLL